MSTATKAVVGPEQLRFNAIANSRLSINRSHNGKVIRAKIQGNPTLGYYDAKNNLTKDIYNFNVSKDNYFDSPRFADLHAKAIALENSGDTLGASELFTQMLNESQLTFGQINNGAKLQLAGGAIVDLFIAEVETVDKETGEVRTSLVVDSMTPVQAVTLTKSKRFGADVEIAVAPAAEIAAVVTPAMS
jgi:hypothetical protein